MWSTWAFCKVVHISTLTPYLSIKQNKQDRCVWGVWFLTEPDAVPPDLFRAAQYVATAPVLRTELRLRQALRSLFLACAASPRSVQSGDFLQHPVQNRIGNRGVAYRQRLVLVIGQQIGLGGVDRSQKRSRLIGTC